MSHWLITCAVLIDIGFLLDHVDGEVARYHVTASAAGGYLDNLGHYLTNPLWPLAVSVRYVQRHGQPWVFAFGVVSAISMAGFPRSAREHHVGLLLITSVACLLDGLSQPIVIFGIPATAGLVYVVFYGLVTPLNLVRTTFHNYRLLKNVVR